MLSYKYFGMNVIDINKAKESILEKKVVKVLEGYSPTFLFDFIHDERTKTTLIMQGLYEKQKFNEKVIKDLASANKNNIYAILGSAYWLYECKNFESSLNTVNKALSIDNRNKHGLLLKINVGTILSNAGKIELEELEATIDTAVKNYPNDFNVLFCSIMAYNFDLQTEKNLKKANKLIKHLGKLYPTATLINYYLIGLKDKINGKVHRRY